jgi:vacuolar-type H+-ATPase subunit B/Vma2
MVVEKVNQVRYDETCWKSNSAGEKRRRGRVLEITDGQCPLCRFSRGTTGIDLEEDEGPFFLERFF